MADWIALPDDADAGAGYLAIGLGLYILWKIFAPFIWPFGPCPRCTGRGKHDAPDGIYWRLCRRCGGSGRRTRFGRRIWGGGGD